jgi:ThiF family
MKKAKEFHEGKRWGGLDWADQQREILLVGCGGIGSWTALSLSRICHELIIFDGDVVDVTNVEGGQLFRRADVGKNKTQAVVEICRELGCINNIYPIDNMYKREDGSENVVITGLDNMTTRKEVFMEWRQHVRAKATDVEREKCLLIDGRMLGELCEVLCVQGNSEEQMNKYEKEYLFSDEEVEAEDCTTKSTTFAAMMIAGMITATLCNWLTNKKLGEEFRENPFWQRFYLPLLDYKQINIEQNAEKETAKAVV